MTLLNIAEICPHTRTLGPGNRFVIWVQGCSFNCPGCISPEWIPQTKATLIDPEKLGNLILSQPNLDGITVSGGEPMLQAIALTKLFQHLRNHRDISIICYTGFTLDEIRTKADIIPLLELIDVIIDGQYIASLNDNQGWRGSSNQNIHFLTPRHLPQSALFTTRKRDVELHIRNDSALMVGVPPHGFREDFKQAVKL
ncbi:MAG: 4Fe-4S single cluster domain-containing protein [Limnospira sp. PMC 894.15]|uniref:4Fe-4S single cluster domain-containing protein n=1 Tax=unclassified Limnospira TaxID=2642885 RepID=UPI0028E10A2D|nr:MULTISPECIES: 4Fe-4S single cluster domain-containing protein [unclassified Limnospira]MDT9189752.1 4Fe-4S single cluster domain-containing protein [Limnospira sp. PMC 894.15]MDT9235471.1 4Fe-4S single cluster domain-containing protein [Limnospira sp. PMC 917.15]